MLKNNGFHNRHSPLPFSPLSLFSGGAPGAWYDPSDFTTLFQDSGGTTPVTGVEQPVGRILDKSGNNNHAFQATGASRPVLKIDGNGNYYLKFDGVDDSLATNSISFTSTDKMSVFAGLRKLSDAAIAVVAEIGGGGAIGSFGLAAPLSVASNYGSILTGNVSGSPSTASLTATTFTAPLTNVVTLLLDISQPTRETESLMRVNGATPTLAYGGAASAGTGNFGNQPLYIGRRGNSSLPFNGNLYSMVIVGKAVTASELISTETWINGKTGAYA